MPRLILATRRGHESRLAEYRELGWEIWVLPEVGGSANRGSADRRAAGPGSSERHVSLAALARRCGRAGLLRVLVESGPGLAGALLSRDLADEIDLYVAPIVLGGGHGWPLGYEARGIGSARGFEYIEQARLGADTRLRLRRKGLVERLRLPADRV